MINYIAYLFGSLLGAALLIGTIFYFIKRRTITFRQAIFNPSVIIASLVISFTSQFNNASTELSRQLASHVYPNRAVVEFVQGCKKDLKESKVDDAIAKKICACSIVEFQASYTYGEFDDILKEMTNDLVSPSESTKAKMHQILNRCNNV